MEKGRLGRGWLILTKKRFWFRTKFYQFCFRRVTHAMICAVSILHVTSANISTSDKWPLHVFSETGTVGYNIQRRWIYLRVTLDKTEKKQILISDYDNFVHLIYVISYNKIHWVGEFPKVVILCIHSPNIINIKSVISYILYILV